MDIKRLILIITGVVIFGILMGLKDSIPNIWARAAIAAVAGAVFSVMLIIAFRHRKN